MEMEEWTSGIESEAFHIITEMKARCSFMREQHCNTVIYIDFKSVPPRCARADKNSLIRENRTASDDETQ